MNGPPKIRLYHITARDPGNVRVNSVDCMVSQGIPLRSSPALPKPIVPLHLSSFAGENSLRTEA